MAASDRPIMALQLCFPKRLSAAIDPVTSAYDYMLKIVAPSIIWLQLLMNRLLEDDINIEKFSSRIALRQPLD
ncbi:MULTISPECIES: hypothetical protein [Pseudomonas]|uniref:hypothetical protein n=1 Tax=Pseudomonas TaxID=286 RepID=UPI003905E573